MDLKTQEGFHYLVLRSEEGSAPCIYYLGLPQEMEGAQRLSDGFGCTIVYIVIDQWDDQLTPWPAKGLYRNDPDFRGEAAHFLDALVNRLIPAIEEAEGFMATRRAIAGYSLAGLFSVYAFANCALFSCVASMSGSFWYEGWTDYIASLDLDKRGCSAFFSLGDRERKAKEKILHRVQENTEITIEVLESWGVTVRHHLVLGGHFDNVYERVREGLAFLDEMLTKDGRLS